ncbi:non-ribosomal peptide synthetase [Actinokineospora terrae]|uniref:Amino acid adenylation domain-containing protein/thioester reductase domain-containing protein n=1 Tax=Actinokineospora terrae TaxID=155974 RepID=A0A1H9KXB8_9PSEU|nr:non-ribosomal peptide synthetase [Actinokineospora terrae]SER03810.1 amino acid adenylation domain-containing protein/thioester reductase domain-containing protein [Actinokineospora terrae]
MTLTDSATERFPTSPAQAGLWFASTYGDDPTAYNQPLVLRPRVPLDHAHLVEALRVVHRDHSALRTVFELSEPAGDVRQVVHADLPPIVDVRDQPREHSGWVTEQVAEVAGTVFDLRDGPLVRVRHLRLGDEGTSVLVFNVHHTVFDGMSWKPYLSQVEAAYTAIAAGREPERTARRQAVESYARWAERADAPTTAAYWRDKLADAPVATPIGLPGEGRARNVTRHLVLDAELTTRLREFCAAEGFTTSMVFVALYFLLLHRHTRQEDVLVGMPVTVREGADAGVVGHLTNTTVLRHRLAEDATARDVLRSVKRELLEVLRHRHAPLEAVVGDLRGRRGGQGGVNGQGATVDLFTAMVTVMPAEARRLDLPDWGVKTWDYTPGGAKYDLALVVDESPEHYTMIVEHNSRSAEGGAFTGHLVGRLETLLRGVVAEPDALVRDLPWISAEERRALASLCERQADAPTLGTEVADDLLTAAIAEAGADTAVVADGVETTYAELDKRVDSIAAGLAARGVGESRPVAVLLWPGLDLVTTILGILRAGGSYVTFDVGQPSERLNFALGDCGARILVKAADVEVDLPDELDVVSPSDVDSGQPFAATVRKSPTDPVYTVYTSGSTGRPKGVVLPEVTLTNLVRNQAAMSAGRRMRTLQYMSPGFDVIAEEVFGTLCTGGTLIIPPAATRTDFVALAEFLAEHRVERAFFPYVALRELAAVLRSSTVDLPGLCEVYVTGERLTITDDLRAMFKRYPDARLSNIYGPSEAHLCTGEELPADPDEWPTLPSIGRVVAGVDARVLADGRQVPFGVEGELCVAGPVVSPGYIGLPEKTAQAMVDDPFAPGQLMYRTGDVVVLAPDGRLHFRGRADDQVKIRGYRVEPGEVEAVLERVLDIEAAVVVVVPAGADRALHAFVRGAEPPADWRALLGADLPGYMIPRQVTRLDTIPVTPNGKTDHRALRAWLDEHEEDAPAAEVTWTDAERAMADLWTEVLGDAPADPDADFFLLGGHSLLAARLHRLVRERLGADVPLSALLNTPTVRGMTASLGDRGAPVAPDLRAEAQLHDLVVGERQEPVDGIVLLTGATGFLGSHLLDELLRQGRRVSCVVRADSVEAARGRLREAFDKFAISTGVDQVGIVLGDLSQPRLGLGEGFEALARSVSEVYHAAAHINFVVPYHTVKRTNVDGLRHLLDFCGINRTPLRLISTLGVFPPDSTPDPVAEDTIPGDPESLGIGYSQSKWVAEHLALQARAAGLPITLHRVGRIGGHSRTGACRHDDFFWLQLKGFALLGRFPEDITDAPPVDLLPVDNVAESIIRLSDAAVDNENWHVHHGVGLTWPEIIDSLREQGHTMTPTTRSEWLAALEEQAQDDDQGEGLGTLVPLMREGVMRLGTHTFDNAWTRRALADLGYPQPEQDTGWVRRMFDYFRANGTAPRPDAANRGGRDA